MRVTRRDNPAASPTGIARPHPRVNVALQAGLLILVFTLGFVAHRRGWHRPLVAFATSFVRRPGFTAAALLRRSDLPTLYVDLRFKDYQRLLDQRSQALRLGAHVASASDYVPAGISHANANVAVQMRLLEGPARALSGETWPFEVIVQDDGSLLDLRRFTLVPAGATSLSTWGYLETLRQADLLASRYHVVRLVLNGAPQGLYALEEQLTVESLVAQERSENTIAWFDQSAYWEAYARLGDALPGSGFQYARIAVDCAPAYTSTLTTCDDAVRGLQALQAGERVPSDVLDVDKMGAFMALTTLWRGTSELDWRAVRLAYDPVTARFEPIGASDGPTPMPVAPWPDRFTDDPGVQVAYVRALAQFSHPDYLAQLRAGLEDDLEALQQALGAEMGYLELPWPALETHQAVMRHQISPSRMLFAYVEADDAALVLRLSNVQPFPVEIAGLDLGEYAVLAIDPAWVDESDRAALVDVPDAVVLRAVVASTPRPVRLRVPPEALPAGHEWVGQTPGAIRVVTRLFGLASQNIFVTVEQ